MRVHWTKRALRRIDQHIDFIARWSPSAGYHMGQRVRHAVENLADHPLLGREGRYIGTRELVVESGRYIVVYRVRGQVVQIVTIHDARQEWPEDWRKA
ncbi:MAG: type II toxin-antitoxin system RelE/ParE family toxin [Chloroflexi bacterium]|nr:type II toxin-antitoxin system RelE/ParE family toxin [Chloroflexota bacterium]